MTEKSELRRTFRAAAAPDADASRAICDRILNSGAYLAAKRVFAFYPMKSEPDIQPVLEDILASGKTLLLPYCEPAGKMRALQVTAMDRLLPGLRGIPEPPDDASELTPDLILVPAVAFDAEGYRLGHGGGYYDRYLSRFSGIALGVSFEARVVECVPREPHDLPVTAVVTECRTIWNAAWKGGLPDGGSV